MDKWINVKDRLPKTEYGLSDYVLMAVSDIIGNETILMVGFYTFIAESSIYKKDGKYMQDGKWEWCRADGPFRGGTALKDIDIDYIVTHWMPLPEAPEDITYDMVDEYGQNE